MKRWQIIAVIAAAMMISIPTVSEATSVDNKSKQESKVETSSKYGVLTPEKRSFSLDKKIAFINGVAPTGTVVNIKVYGTTDLTGKKYDLLNLPKKDEYIELSSDDLIVGKLGIFDKQLDLVNGINRIFVDFKATDAEDVEIVVFVSGNDKLVVKDKLTTLIQKADK